LYKITPAVIYWVTWSFAKISTVKSILYLRV